MIYFIRDPLTKRVKIGLSDTPWARLAQIQTGCPTDLEMVAVIDGGATEEAALHQQFRVYHVRGEWFAETAELSVFVAGLPPAARTTARVLREPCSPLDAWMNANGVRSKDLADRFGYSEPCISHLRTGRRQPTLDFAVQLMELTGLRAQDFVVITPTRLPRKRAA